MATVTGMTAEYLETRLGEKVDTAALNELVDDRVSVLLRDGSDSPFAYDDTAGKLVIPSGGGGGTSGWTQGQIGTQSGTFKMLSGEGNLDYDAVRWNAPSNVLGTGVPSWITTGTTGLGTAHEIYLEEGWYELVALFVLSWSVEANAPGALGPYTGGGWDAAHADYGIFPITCIGTSKWGIAQYVNYGKFFFHDGDEMHPEVRPIGPWATADSDGIIDRCFLTFTKFG